MPTFCKKLSNDNAEWLLNQLPRFYEIFDENLYIPEESFAAILGERDGVVPFAALVGSRRNVSALEMQKAMWGKKKLLKTLQVRLTTA
jgi:hypothetical protein